MKPPRQMYIMNERRVICQGAFRFKPPRFFKRPISWLWHKFATPDTETTFERVTLREENIIRLIEKGRGNLDMIRGNEVKHVIVGPEEAFELKSIIMQHAIHCGMKIPVGLNGQINVFGLAVHVIPWFDGVLLLPDLKP